MSKQHTPKIVLILVQFPKLSESFIVNKFVGLLEAGHDVHIVCQRSAYTEWSHFSQLSNMMKDRVHLIWPRDPRWLVLLLLPMTLVWGFLRKPTGVIHYLKTGWRQSGSAIFKQYYLDLPLILLQPELVHFSFGALAVGQTELKARLKCRMTASFRGYDLNYVGLEEEDYYMRVWQSLDGCHFLGRDLWKRAQQRGCPADKLHVLIPPAIDVNSFKPSPCEESENERPLRILSVGRLSWVKGYEYGLQALKQIYEQDIAFEYRMIGDGPYRQPLAFWRHHLGLEDMVTLLGSQPHDCIEEQLDWADVFLHPAVSEGFGNAALEAQLMGIPVVCSDAGGLPESVIDGETGFVVPRRNPTAIAQALIRLAGSPSLRRQLGQAGRQRVMENFTLHEQVRAFSIFFQRILSTSSDV